MRFLIFLIFVSGFWGAASVSAQTSSVVLTWQADNYYPARYQGKAAATFNTPVTIAAETIKDNKILDTAVANFTWYIDEKVFKRGEGLKEIVFTVKKFSGSEYTVRAIIESGDEVFEGIVKIPVSKPVLAISFPFPNNLVRAGSEVLIKAVPYFFQIASPDELSYFWNVNNEKKDRKGSQITLRINPPASALGGEAEISVSAQKPDSPLEFGKERIRFRVY